MPVQSERKMSLIALTRISGGRSLLECFRKRPFAQMKTYPGLIPASIGILMSVQVTTASGIMELNALILKLKKLSKKPGEKYLFLRMRSATQGSQNAAAELQKGFPQHGRTMMSRI